MPNSLKTTPLTESWYQNLYKQSVEDPKTFWAEQANKFVSWFKPWETVVTGTFEQLNLEWFNCGKLNACYNCLDRHLSKNAAKTAVIWEGNDGNSIRLTYAELFEQVCRFANVLKKFGVKKGDCVCIYLPMIPEVIIAMLACARIGAIHSVIFAGFSAEAIKNRVLDANCTAFITADFSTRGTKIIPLKEHVDNALIDCPKVKTVIVVKCLEDKIRLNSRDHWWHEEIKNVTSECNCEEMDPQDPLFILYTSGSTGKPKGILHTTGGYLVYSATTHHYIFDYQKDDIFWCTADVGWITGHTYIVYGPLCNGASIVIYEGVPEYPTASRYWEIVAKHKISIMYTSPTAIRILRRDGDKWVKAVNRDSLRILGSVGEPISPAVWQWYYQVVGDERCPIVDTWWQTETGGIMISAFPTNAALKPGSAAWPFFGIKPAIFDDQGQPLPPNKIGKLVILKPWPGMAKTIYNNSERFFNAYFKEYPGVYLTGDDAYYDEQGYYWIVGRNDDVLKVSGHRIGTAEIESAFLKHSKVAEAAVVPIPDEIKGEAIYAFITLKKNIKGNEVIKKELISMVKECIGGLAAPKYIQWSETLPKTRSGKIMRRLLRKIANNDLRNFGDISTLADPEVIEKLIQGRLIK